VSTFLHDCGVRETGTLKAVTLRPWAFAALLGLVVMLLSGCGTLQYYAQAISGHTGLLLRREPIERLLARPGLDADLRHKLELIVSIRAFARDQGLDVGDAYTGYVQTGQQFVVWNVFAAPRFSLTMKQFCFPIAGCTSYKGFFSERGAMRLAEELKGDGLDVYVGGVAAYSTLGWFADPVLDTFIMRADAQLAGLIFHELAHREVYVPGDTRFNESFATAVEQILVARWLTATSSEEQIETLQGARVRRSQVLELVTAARAELAEVYRAPDLTDQQRLAAKGEALGRLQTNYQTVRSGWGVGHDDYLVWMTTSLNNAKLGTLADYNDWVDSFLTIYADSNDDLVTFLTRIREVAAMQRGPRDRLLASLAGAGPVDGTAD
jgi:predicted aminopeptidase